jgi:hypothetical protein
MAPSVLSVVANALRGRRFCSAASGGRCLTKTCLTLLTDARSSSAMSAPALAPRRPCSFSAATVAQAPAAGVPTTVTGALGGPAPTGSGRPAATRTGGACDAPADSTTREPFYGCRSAGTADDDGRATGQTGSDGSPGCREGHSRSSESCAIDISRACVVPAVRRWPARRTAAGGAAITGRPPTPRRSRPARRLAMTTGHKLHGGPTTAAAGPADRWSPHGANAPEPATVSPSSATRSVPCSAHSVNAEAGRKPTVRRAFAASVMTRASARSSGAGRVTARPSSERSQAA